MFLCIIIVLQVFDEFGKEYLLLGITEGQLFSTEFVNKFVSTILNVQNEINKVEALKCQLKQESAERMF